MMRKLLLNFILALGLMQTISSLQAQEAQLIRPDNEVEAQVQRLSEELRCLVCQNQTIADSHAGLAEDLKKEIREMSNKGMTDEAIVDYMVARYGDFVRYRPPLKASTILLWVGPFLLLLAGGSGLLLQLRARQKLKAQAPLTEEEAQKVKALLDLNKDA